MLNITKKLTGNTLFRESFSMEERSNNIRLMMKIETRAATKMFFEVFAQERLELIVDCFNIWTFVDEEIDLKEMI